MRLVDADNALELFRAEYQKTENLIKQGEKQLDSLAEGYTEAAHIIKYISLTVDAVPVVRCKDCKYYKPDEFECGCDFAGGLPYVKADDFCSFGQRRDQFAGSGNMDGGGTDAP